MTDAQVLRLLIEKFGAAKRANGDWVRVRCPTCAPADKYKMKRGVNLKSLSSNCFICGVKLDLEQIFGGMLIPTGLEDTGPPPDHPQAKVWPCDAIIPVSALPKDHPAVDFLKKDHITDLTSLYLDYDVGFISKEDAHDIIFDKGQGSVPTSLSVSDSLIFPVFFKGEMVGWQCRFIPGTPHGDRMKKMKYLHIFQKGKYLYNYDNAKQFKCVIVVEGVKKSWKFPNAVATFGKGISADQIQLIQQWDEIIFMYDAGEEAQAKSRELAEVIGRGKKCINIDPGKFGYDSPDEMTQEVAQTIVYQEWIKKFGEQ
jgi:hypothetical protein